jgi:hypothetical protein
MCIDCARRFFNRLDLRSRASPPSDGWYICVIDHADHVHVRIDSIHSRAEWCQITASHDDLLSVLAEQAIPHIIHLHENTTTTAATTSGCSNEIIDALHREKLSAEQAALSSTDRDACAVCYDAFNPGDEVVTLPCSHRYHAACVTPWLRRATSCPTCRADVTRSAVGLPEAPAASPPAASAAIVEAPILRHATLSPPRAAARSTGGGSDERLSEERGAARLPARRRAIRRIGSWISACRSPGQNDAAAQPCRTRLVSPPPPPPPAVQ